MEITSVATAAPIETLGQLAAQLPAPVTKVTKGARALHGAGSAPAGEEVAERLERTTVARLLGSGSERELEVGTAVEEGSDKQADQGSEEDGVKHRHVFLYGCRGTAVPAPAERLVEAQGLADALRVEAKAPADANVGQDTLAGPVVDAALRQREELRQLLGRQQTLAGQLRATVGGFAGDLVLQLSCLLTGPVTGNARSGPVEQLLPLIWTCSSCGQGIDWYRFARTSRRISLINRELTSVTVFLRC